jgi:hypothetical protein
VVALLEELLEHQYFMDLMVALPQQAEVVELALLLTVELHQLAQVELEALAVAVEVVQAKVVTQAEQVAVAAFWYTTKN